MDFLDALKSELNVTETENGAKAYKSTKNEHLDLFAKIAASRESVNEIISTFALSFESDPEIATRILFWSRDIRGGQGERKVFRAILNYLARQNEKLAIELIPLVPEYGRWDDLLCLEYTSVWKIVLDLFKAQIQQDLDNIENNSISLLGKWLPSINASSEDSKRLGRKIAQYFGWSEKQYRKTLVRLREKIKIVETSMCSNNWSEIEYSKVPSRASFMYRKAFLKRDAERYSQYLKDVNEGKSKINSATLYPYDIVRNFFTNYNHTNCEQDVTLDLQWNNLPNFIEDESFNGLVVADVSGSMTVNNYLPLSVSISLAIYIAERNNSSLWKNKFITFSKNPEIQSIIGKTIQDKVLNLSNSSWGFNTDLIKVFEAVLNAAKTNSVKPEDMPDKLIIISDMQFDEACFYNKMTNFEKIKELYTENNYELPSLVFWNVNSNSNVPITVDDNGTCIVSGASPSILKTILQKDTINPLDIMNQTLYDERYEQIGNVFFTNDFS